MRRTLAACVAIGASWALVAACGSVPEVTFGDGGSSGGPVEGGGGDGPTPPPPPCGHAPSAEVCDDGIDNDCNGKTDCQDPACGGFQCEPPTPSGGWAPILFADAQTAICPTGWGAQSDVSFVTGDGTDGSCACTCNGSGGTVAKCSDGQYALSTYAASGTCGGTATVTNFNAQTAACIMLATPVPYDNAASGQVVAPLGPATCTNNVVITKSNVTPGRTCAAPPKIGAGCGAPEVCVPKVAGLRYCVAQSGLHACPAPFTVRRRAGSSANDTRACNTCTCGSPTACSGTLTVASTNNCTGGQSQAFASGAACAASSFNNNGKIQGYTATISGGCGAPVGFNTGITGSVAFTGDETICCTN